MDASQGHPASSTRSLQSHMIRERDVNIDVWKFYKEQRRIGEGSIGNVSLVKRKRGTEGGSAYAVHRSGVDVGCGGVLGAFGRWRPQRRKRPPPRRGLPPSVHSETFALKSIHLRLVKKDSLDELRNEITVLKALDHPNIVKAYEVYESRQNIYVVMEYCSGGDLFARAPYTEAQVVDVISQLCSAISYMHKHGVVHRDLKIENIMFESSESTARIRVLDFGLSKKFLPGASGLMRDWVGTLYTMSPQVLNGVYTAKADCWAIGVIAYLLLCNEKPFWGAKRAQVMRNIKRCQYSFGAHAATPAARDFVAALLVYDQTDRLSAAAATHHPWLAGAAPPVPGADAAAGRDLMGAARENIMSYARTSELRRIAAVVVAHKSSFAEITDMRRAFERFDKKRDGVISMEEFLSALSEFNCTEKELHDMFSQMDVNNNGVILYTEFLAATLQMNGRLEEKRLAEAFDHIDDDDSGFISKENLVKLLGENSPKIEKLIKEGDRNGDGRISFEDFLVLFRNDHSSAAEEGLAELGS